MIKDKHQRFKDDLAGITFGKLTAKYITKIDSKKRAYWFCECSCGGSKEVRRNELIDLRVKSCGCLTHEAIRMVAGPIKNVAVRRVHTKYRQSAEKRGIEFNLTPVQVEEIVTKPCVYCGKEPENCITRERIKDTFNYSGIDRVDNSKGYVLGNVVPCCWSCNQSKHSKTKEEFLSWIKRVYEFNHLENS